MAKMLHQRDAAESNQRLLTTKINLLTAELERSPLRSRHQPGRAALASAAPAPAASPAGADLCGAPGPGTQPTLPLPPMPTYHNQQLTTEHLARKPVALHKLINDWVTADETDREEGELALTSHQR